MTCISLRALLGHCCEGQAPQQPDTHGASPGLRRARDYLHAHLAAPVSLDELAAVAGLGRFRLLRSIARAYGLPPHRYQVCLRIAADQSHLGRHLRRLLGTTPAGYGRGEPLPAGARERLA